MNIGELRPYLTNLKKKGNQWTAECPICHDDHHLFLKEEGDKVLMFCQKCHAEFKDVVKALNIPPKQEEISIIENYDHEYKNPTGEISYYKTRTKYSNGKKKFCFWYYDAKGTKSYKKPPDCNNLYNLDLLAAAEPSQTLYIVEGEKCADIMTRSGFLATTSNTGAGGKIAFSDTDQAMLEKFPSKVVIPDNDEPGEKYAANFKGADVLKLVEVWPEIKPKQDVWDYITGNHDINLIRNYAFTPPKTYADMDKDELLSADTFQGLLAIKDDFERKQAETKCEQRSKELNIFRAYTQNYRAYKISLAKRKQAGSGRETDFPGQSLTLACGEWIADGFGVRKNEINMGSGDVTMKYASPLPIMPTEILFNLDTLTEKIKIEFFKDGKWSPIICDRIVTASANKILELANRGVEVNSENAKLLVQYIAECVASNLDILPRYKAISRLGWIDKDFMPYATDVKFDGEKDNQPLFKAVAQKGELQEWIDFVQPLRKNFYMRMLMAASFASPIIEKVNALPFVFHLFGGTGSGKTCALMVAMSIWGNPKMGRMVRTMNMTINSMLATAAFLCNLPFAGDELQTIKRRGEDYDALIMRLAEGIDRGRMTYSAVNETKTWKCSFLFTGEEPCTQSYSGGGVKNRVIEHECTDVVVEDGIGVVSFVNEHYGCAGIEYIKALGSRKLMDEYNEIFKNIIENVDTTEKQAMAMSLMMLADKIAGEIFFYGEKQLTTEDVKDMMCSKSDIDMSERAYDFVLSLIAKNINKFDASSKGEIWGKIEGTEIYINKDVLMHEMSENGYEFNAVKKKWADKGYLVKNSVGRLTHQTTCNGIKSTYIRFNQKKTVLKEPDIFDEKPF